MYLLIEEKGLRHAFLRTIQMLNMFSTLHIFKYLFYIYYLMSKVDCFEMHPDYMNSKYDSWNWFKNL